MAAEHLRHRARVRTVPIHPDTERLHAAQHEVAVEGRRDRADGVLAEGEALGERCVVRREEATDDVRVPAEVLGGRVHDDVGPERERPLEIRRRERVVDDDARACRTRDTHDACDVDDVQQRVRGRLDPHDLRRRTQRGAERVEVADADRRPLDAGLGEHPSD